MAPSIKAETAKLLKETTDAITAMDKENKTIQPKFKDISGKLDGAIKSSNDAMIKLYSPKLDELVDQLDGVMTHVETALGSIRELQKDEDFAKERFEVIEKLMKTVTETRVKLTKELEDAEKLHDLANSTLDDLQGGHDEGVRALALLKDEVGGLKKTVTQIETDYPKQEDKARDAYGTRNQKALTEARLKLIDYQGTDMPVQNARTKVQAFQKKYHDKDLTTEATYLLDDLGQMDDLLKKVKQAVKDLITLGQVEKIDLAKAAKLLDIDSKDQAELGKILNGPQAGLAKGLDALAKKLKLDTDSKEMIAKLKKGGIPI